MRAVRELGVSWATVNKARTRRVLLHTAQKLAKFARGAFFAHELAKPAPKRRRPSTRRGEAANG